MKGPMSTLAVLHIGTKKTGTTYLQNLLINNQQVLADAGWTYPDFLDRRNHLTIALPFAANKDTEIHRAQELTTEEANAALVAEFDKQFTALVKPGDKWVFSSEFFASRLKTQAEVGACVGFLRKYFDEVKVVVYYRRPEFMVPSTYSQSVKEGLSRDLDMGYVERHRNDYAHLELLTRWQDVVGAANVTARPYLERFRSDSRAMVDDFCAAVGIEPKTDWVEPTESASNHSLGTEGLQVLRTINFYFPRPGTTYTRPIVRQRAAVARRVQAMPITMTNAQIAAAIIGIVDREEKISAAFVAQIIARLSKPAGVVDWNDPKGHPDLDGWRRKARTARTKMRAALKGK